MKTIKRVSALLLALMLLLVLTACDLGLKKAEPTPEPTPEATPEATPEPTPEPTPRLTAGPGLVTGDGVYFRNGPDTGERVIAIYNTGKPITILRVEGDWVVAEIDGYTGYLSAAYVEMDEALQSAGSTGGTAGTISIDGVNFRSGPSMTAEIISTLSAGTPVTILAENGEWMTVTVDGQRGYIFGEYVTKSEAGAQPAESPAPEESPEPTPAPAAAPTAGGATGTTGNTGRTPGNTGRTTGNTGGSTGGGGGTTQPAPDPSGEVTIEDGSAGGGEVGGGDVPVDGEILIEP